MPSASPSSVMRSWMSGRSGVEQRAVPRHEVRVRVRGHEPARCRYGTSRSRKSSGASIRMCAELIASAFFWSKRAGFGLTSATSNAAVISAIVKMSRSGPIDQPSSAR